MLTLYRGDAEGPHDQLANPYRPADVDAWPVDAPTAADPRLAVFQRPDSAQAKAYRVLRHRLLGLDNPRVVLVTSAVAGEGKSAVAANLALALAEEVTTRVLLVEANAKRPSLSALFQFIPPRCFLEQVAELAVTQPRWTVAELMGTRLHLAAIDPDSSHPRSIDRVLFAAAMRQLRRSYDYVIIDGPAALETADVNAAADAADGTLLVSIAKKSSRRALARALEQLKPAPILGVALLGAGREGSRDGS
jgi:Mrp family chromosome partitioning ATPase